jgi:hypothetical protein
MHRLFVRKSAHLETDSAASSVLWVIYLHNEDPSVCNVHTLDPVYQTETRTVADISIQHTNTSKYLAFATLASETSDRPFCAVTVVSLDYRLTLWWTWESKSASRISNGDYESRAIAKLGDGA